MVEGNDIDRLQLPHPADDLGGLIAGGIRDQLLGAGVDEEPQRRGPEGIFRCDGSGVPSRSRSAGGVIVMRLGEEQKLVNFTKVAKAEDKDEEPLEEAEEQTEQEFSVEE